ncbi:MAG: hypothetical protein NTY82_02860 [Actinobacteria bacterium]|nr:hypothetical protein [Actinomycetota bacterium]
MLDPNFEIIVVDAPKLAPQYIETVQTIWDMREDSDIDRFDGRIFCVTEISSRQISGYCSDYRFLFAQHRYPELAKSSTVRPLAVSGALFCSDGLVIGLRSKGNVLQSESLWELAPSGGIEPGSHDEVTKASCLNQILIETQEELGWDGSPLRAQLQNVLFEDSDSHVVDLLATLETYEPFETVRKHHEKTGTAEYQSLSCLSLTDGRIETADLPKSASLAEISLEIISYLNRQR